MTPTFDIQVYDAADGISVITYAEDGTKRKFDFRDEAEHRRRDMLRLCALLVKHRDPHTKFRIKGYDDF